MYHRFRLTILELVACRGRIGPFADVVASIFGCDDLVYLIDMYSQTVLLFGLNLLDALLTIWWVRSGVATEGNQLMAELLNIGNFPFLAVKVAIGAVTVTVLLRYSERPLARYGLTASLAVYLGLMLVHLFTGLSAFGVLSSNFAQQIVTIPTQLFAALI